MIYKNSNFINLKALEFNIDMRTIFILFSLLFTLTVNAASHKELPAKGNLSLQVFDNANVRFLPLTSQFSHLFVVVLIDAL